MFGKQPLARLCFQSGVSIAGKGKKKKKERIKQEQGQDELFSWRRLQK